MTLRDETIKNTIDNLLNGRDYRTNILNAINADFIDFAIIFFKEIVNAKYNDESINLEWYKTKFINNGDFKPEEAAIYAGLNKKSITNVYGSAAKKIVLEAANANFDYLSTIIGELENDVNDGLALEITISYKDISVKLNLTESLLAINALATKKMAIRGGAWSSIGKRVEKPLVLRLCELCGVSRDCIDSRVFSKNEALEYDREVDFKFLKGKESYRVEVKLMGKGNPESADVIFARDTDIFIADTLSEQNKKQLKSNNIYFLELKDKNQKDTISEFKKIMKKIGIL